MPSGLIQTRRRAFRDLARRIVSCRRCPRLRRHCMEVARTKRRAYREQEYWGRPVPGFGDPDARLLIIGLAPAAHGANRTGRMFTGDASGDWLFAALHRHGFASAPHSRGPGDGMRLRDAYLSAAARCAPPGNRPTAEELAHCLPFLAEEIRLLRRVWVLLCLGRIAYDATLRALAASGRPWPGRRPSFGHALVHRPPVPRLPVLVTSYHPSRQNTQTGRLTAEMWDRVFRICREILERGRGDQGAGSFGRISS
jgi:uracil-DNA glycosylase family 4